MADEKIWSGRFAGSTDSLMEQFSFSLHFDQKLFDADIAVNKAWAKALVQVGVYSDEEADRICSALEQISKDFHAGRLPFPSGVEDIHSANEKWLTDRLGDLGARIHTGRSRNDQVATDFRIYLREKNQTLQSAVKDLQSSLCRLATVHQDTIFAGQTHLRQAQPISFAHYLLSVFFQMQRDRERLAQHLKRSNKMPLGSGALAGAAFEIDRHKLAADLGFDEPSENSYDATSDRDFVSELLYICAQIMIHLSRVAEDFIIWSSEAFRYLEVDEKYATGSSMMPQKRNPDSLELIRGKSARVIGAHVALMTLQKGAPTAYVRDMQEDKESTFDAVEQTILALRLMSGVIRTLQIHKARMRASLDPALYATDLADFLVRKGLPFRKAHNVVGSAVAYCEEQQKMLSDLSLDELRRFSQLFDESVHDLFDPDTSLEKRNINGGTGKKSVAQQIKSAKQLLDE